VIATKVSGPGNMSWIRGGPEALNASAITEALEGSLARLSCDYIDLYQLHWPDRCAPEGLCDLPVQPLGSCCIIATMHSRSCCEDSARGKMIRPYTWTLAVT